MEKHGGFNSWMRYGMRGLDVLLEEIEKCNKKRPEGRFESAWLEDGAEEELGWCIPPVYSVGCREETSSDCNARGVSGEDGGKLMAEP